MNYFIMKGKTKYVLSKIDEKEYCKTNGHFNRYLEKNGLTEEEYFSTYIGERKYCYCNKVCTFEKHIWEYLPTCGHAICVGKEISKSISLQSKDQLKEISLKKSIGLKKHYSSPKGLLTKQKILDKITKEGVQEIAKSKRMITCKERYGNPYYANAKKASETKSNWTDDRRTKIYKLAIETKFKKYGSMISHEGRARLKELKDTGHWFNIRKKTEATWMKKYGVPYFPKSPFIGNTSKPQRKFCDLLHNYIDGGNSQYNGCELRLERFHYDFAFNKKIIEFNGDYWHASPLKYYPTDIVSLPKGKKIQAQDIWEKELKKINLAIEHGYEIKIIWESDFKKDEDKCVKDCILWLQK